MWFDLQLRNKDLGLQANLCQLSHFLMGWQRYLQNSYCLYLCVSACTYVVVLILQRRYF